MESKRRSNNVLQSRNGREWAQNNKIGILGLTYGPGGTPDPKLPSQAMRTDEEDGASSGAPARNDGATLTHFQTPLARVNPPHITCKPPYNTIITIRDLEEAIVESFAILEEESKLYITTPIIYTTKRGIPGA
ncbi:hypothetical protein E3N88_26126 [Mikania micrantha]|uniref:Uncharacterized protein n=1 Tax=Mikania micrantha TaxID=192012 RepID=A0A5N6N780_9ASTR|nr:hypothetical protein E3N88_26126 [Mikania micrantha]